VLLLAGPGRLAAQDSASRLFSGSADSGWPAPSETTSLRRSPPIYHLLPEESRTHEPWIASADLGTDSPLSLGLGAGRPTETPLTSADAFSWRATEPASRRQLCPTHRLLPADSGECEQRTAFADLTLDPPPQLESPEAEVPRSAFMERHRVLLTTLIPVAGLVFVTANSLLGYETQSRIHHEAGSVRTTNGGADKASHLTDYFILTNLYQDVYRMLGYSENAAILWGFGMAIATGLANEVSDGFTKHGFSFEDLAMDAAGATAASLIRGPHQDLLGMRTSTCPALPTPTTCTLPISSSPDSADGWESTSDLCAGCSSRSPMAPRVTGSHPRSNASASSDSRSVSTFSRS
jgi:VanZ family protein